MAVTQCKATDADGNTVSFAIAGGEDSALFVVEKSTGVLTFRKAPDFEKPGDAGMDNIYKVVVAASDGKVATSQSLAIQVTNLADETVGIGRTSPDQVWAEVLWIDVHGREITRERQWLDPEDPSPAVPAGLHGLVLARIRGEGLPAMSLRRFSIGR